MAWRHNSRMPRGTAPPSPRQHHPPPRNPAPKRTLLATRTSQKPNALPSTPAVAAPARSLFQHRPRLIRTLLTPPCHRVGRSNLCMIYSESLAHSSVSVGALLDTYFSRFHGKPFFILDESFVKQRLQLGQLPQFLVQAICAVAARYYGPLRDTMQCNGREMVRG